MKIFVYCLRVALPLSHIIMHICIYEKFLTQSPPDKIEFQTF